MIWITEKSGATDDDYLEAMNRLLQIVAITMAVLLAVPASVAQGICFMAGAAEPALVPNCCTHMDRTMMNAMGENASMSASADAQSAQAPSVEMQSCGSNCCSVSPQVPPVQTAQQKAQPANAPVSDAGSVYVEPLYASCQAVSSALPHSSSAPLRILLKTLRI